MTELSANPEMELHQASFEYYEELLRPLNESHPQRQGLTSEEFLTAVSSNDVAKTCVEVEGRRLLLPQLAPIGYFQWLNVGVYEKTFPDTEMRNYTDLQQVEPSDDVKQGIIDLASTGGVLTFDFPDTDPDYAERLVAFVQSLGVKCEPIEELAKQTYFSGQTTLKNRSPEELGNPVDMMETFEKAVADGTYDTARFDNGASALRVVDLHQAQAMNDFYEAAYETLNNTEYCKQGLDADEFLQMMTEEPDVAKIVNTVDGEIVSLLLLDNDLTKLSWVNHEYYQKMFPEKYEKGQVMWFPGLAANPEKQGGLNTQVMVDLVAELGEWGGNDINVVFDCGNTNTGFLDVFLSDMINKTEEASIDIREIAHQKYCAVRLSI